MRGAGGGRQYTQKTAQETWVIVNWQMERPLMTANYSKLGFFQVASKIQMFHVYRMRPVAALDLLFAFQSRGGACINDNNVRFYGVGKWPWDDNHVTHAVLEAKSAGVSCLRDDI